MGMKVKMMMNANNMSYDELRALLQKLREWELQTARSEVDGLFFETDPEMTSEETRELFAGIYPEFKHLVEVPRETGSVLSLGSRNLFADGEAVGSLEEFTFTIGRADETVLEKIQNAYRIELTRIGRG